MVEVQKEIILKPKLPTFVQKYNLIIQQDRAPSHAAAIDQELLNECGIETLNWPGKSPDLNMSEPAWLHMKEAVPHRHGWEDKGQLPGLWEAVYENIGHQHTDDIRNYGRQLRTHP